MLDDDFAKLVASVLSQVIQYPTGERTAVLDRLCYGHPAQLRAEVQRLLSGHFAAGAGRPALVRDALNTPSDSDRFTSTVNFSVEDDLAEAIAQPLGAQGTLTRIAQYRIDGVLGSGGFGTVYEGYDEQLLRSVAIKVPHPHLLNEVRTTSSYLAEARAVAQLDHPHIVPIYTVGSDALFPFFIVSKRIIGKSLEQRQKSDRLTPRHVASILNTIAEALHHAHHQGLVHRDVKPSNIILDAQDVPYLVDFGVALRDDQVGVEQGRVYIGTPPYMSPEQARGEGHRLDGRSDVFSLGIVMYELLTGRRPFLGTTQHQLIEQITRQEVKPPRQLDDGVPRELERICLKALAKHVGDRYQTARDLAEDLQAFLSVSGTMPSSHPASSSPAINHPAPTIKSLIAGAPVQPQPTTDSVDGLSIVPKGLRSFDYDDADFFLDLLPGARDRFGLPERIRFWKSKLETTDAEQTFPVGLIYGPSGCGKSSFVKAGLLPRLALHVVPVLVEAAPDQTESRLLSALQKVLPAADRSLGLKDLLMSIRRGQWLPAGQKMVIVVDQFEQWLHTHADGEQSELGIALRQCDGRRLQCVLMVRDDFWMPITRFLRELDTPLLENQNSAAVDLFPVRHARKVLTAFGRAYRALDDKLTQEQEIFIQQSVDALADKGKVICVRLALFAELMKDKAWSPASLTEVGGVEGLGTTFLEETFSASTAPPSHRYHLAAAQRLLRAVLPPPGSEIKARKQSIDELRQAAGYGHRSRDFDELLTLLDRELRLITPTDRNGEPESDDVITPRDTLATGRYYQLTHDFLVPSLRDWLNRKREETRHGRAQQRLEDRTEQWCRNRESRYLPDWWETLNIMFLTRRQQRTPSQQQLMAQAYWWHGVRAAATIGLAAALGLWLREMHGSATATQLVQALLRADASHVPDQIQALNDYRRWVTPLLVQVASSKQPATMAEQRERFHAQLALLPRDPSLVEPVLTTLLTTDVPHLLAARQVLAPYSPQLSDRLWGMLRATDQPEETRIRAGLLLSQYETESPHWSDADFQSLVELMLGRSHVNLPELWRAFSPLADRLLPVLERSITEENRPHSEPQKMSAALGVSALGGDNKSLISRLLPVATPSQFAILFPLVQEEGRQVDSALLNIMRSPPPESSAQSVRAVLGRRRAWAAAAVLRLGERQPILDLLQVSDDPEALTQFVHGGRALGVRPAEIIHCLNLAIEQRDALKGDARRPYDSAQFGLLLALGEFRLAELADADRNPVVQRLQGVYAKDPSSAVHGATGWLLRRWGFHQEVNTIDQTPIAYDATGERDWYVEKIDAVAAGTSGPPQPLYFTWIVFQPGTFWMGSSELGEREEHRHRVELTRPFAVMDRELSWEQYDAWAGAGGCERARPQVEPGKENMQWECSPDHPAYGVSWTQAVRYSRWLTRQALMSESDQAYPLLENVRDDVEAPEVQWSIDVSRPGIRLPTEAEWERMCRTGTQTEFSFGSDPTLANHYAWWGFNAKGQPRAGGQLRPNLRGLFDVHGNLFEWCHDRFAIDPNVDVAIDPTGPTTDDASPFHRIRRGNDWSDVRTYFLRSAGRGRTDSRWGSNRDGVRLVRTMTATRSP